MSQATVRAFRFGETTVEVDNTEGKTVRQIAEEVGFTVEGNAIILNGKRLDPQTAAEATVRSGDDLRVAKAAQGGTFLHLVMG